MKYAQNILLMFASIILFMVFAPIGFVFDIVFSYKSFYKICYGVALCVDITGNILMAPLFNVLLITLSGYQFGYPRETISSVLGKNEELGTLQPCGRWLVKVLARFQKNHCEINIETDIKIPD